MGDRPIRYVLSGLAVIAGASGAGATVQTKVVDGSGATVSLARFDPTLGTLLKVSVEANYQAQTGYRNFWVPSGYDHAVAGSASFGGLGFGLAGVTATTDYGSGTGSFVVKAVGNASWSSAADLAKFTSGTGSLLGSGTVSAPTPGYASVSAPAALSYRVTYTYDDGVAGAVPEPATWAMMAGGFAVVGVALRGARRRRQGDAAVSGSPTAS